VDIARCVPAPHLLQFQPVISSHLSNWLRKSLGNGKNNATIKMIKPKFSPGLGEIDCKMISMWNLGHK
jgi:hypothetical protein